MENKNALEDLIRKQLCYLLGECTPEEYDAEEVRQLIKLVNDFDKKRNSPLPYVHIHLPSKEVSDEAGIHLPPYRPIRKKVGVALGIAAACAASIVLIGLNDSIQADPQKGFFYWLSKDDEGVTFITSPENMDSGLSVTTDMKYDTLEDVPEQYLKHMVTKDDLTTLKDYDLQSVSIKQGDAFCTVRQSFATHSGTTQITVGVKIYMNEFILARENHLSEESQQLDGEGWEGNLLVQENTEKDKEYTMIFYTGNRQYFVEGNCDKEELMEIAEEYRQFVMMFHS